MYFFKISFVFFFLHLVMTYANGYIQLILRFAQNLVQELTSRVIKEFSGFYSTFTFIFFSLFFSLNLISFFPEFLDIGPTQYVYTVFLTMPLITACFLIGIYKRGSLYPNHFSPAGSPIWLKKSLILLEVISFFIRYLSISLRIFANCVSGMILLKILLTFSLLSIYTIASAWILPIMAIFKIGFILFELIVVFVHTLVLVFLFLMYLSESL